MPRNAKQMGSQILGVLLALLIGGILVANLLPTAIDQIVGVDTSAWGSTEVAIWDLLPLFLVLVPLAVFAGWAMDAF